jgi:hypothetical protein
MRELIAQEARINKCGWAQRYLQYAFHTICAKFAVIDSLATIRIVLARTTDDPASRCVLFAWMASVNRREFLRIS